LGELFKNLLDISKVDDGRLHANLEAINAVEFTRKLVQNLLPLAENKGLQVIFLPDKSRRFGEAKLKQSLYIQADKQMLTESLTNLIENAIKYTKQGQIEINVTTNKQQEVIMSVKDSGIGIPKEDLPHLFQKFYRVDNRDTREINGTGLGLYLTRRMVEHMRGRIWVESELEKGSIFSIAMTRLDQKQVGQLLDAEQVQPSKLADNKPEPNLTDQEANIVNTETNTLQSNIDTNRETSDVDAVIEAVPTEQNPPDTNKILSRESADRLHQLGYNTEDFTITDDNI
jgi:two-component sensor histidine kinase